MYNVIFQLSSFLKTPKHVTPQIGEILLQEEKATNGVANQPASTYSRGSVLAGGGALITLSHVAGSWLMLLHKAGSLVPPGKKIKQKGKPLQYAPTPTPIPFLQMVLGGGLNGYLNTEPNRVFGKLGKINNITSHDHRITIATMTTVAITTTIISSIMLFPAPLPSYNHIYLLVLSIQKTAHKTEQKNIQTYTN